MISSNFIKFFLILSVTLTLCQSCFLPGPAEQVNSSGPSAETLPNIPFLTKEPDVFQAEMVISNFIDGEKTERKYFMARNGGKKLITTGVGSKNETSLLLLPENRSFLIRHAGKTIQERAFSNDADGLMPEHPGKFLTTKWLSERTEAGFEKLGTEAGLTKYRATLAGSERAEILIFFDEKLKLPVRQEMYRMDGEKKELLFTFEIKNFKTQAGDELFELPENYQKK